jgi:hypothetical protein
MKYILDSNVALKWVLPEPDADKAVQVRDDLRRGILELLSPDIFPIEVATRLRGPNVAESFDQQKAGPSSSTC